MKLTGKLLLATAAVAALSSAAMAADLDIPTQAAPIVSAPAATNWDGPYIGATVGYGWVNADPGVSNSGFLAGGQIGYNFHLADQIVAGIQGNVDYNDESGVSGWDGAVTARLGYDIDTILPYIEAGVAFVGANNVSYTGYTVGAGVEFMLADQLSANVEYRYNGFGDQGVLGNVHSSEVRVGLNYHF